MNIYDLAQDREYREQLDRALITASIDRSSARPAPAKSFIPATEDELIRGLKCDANPEETMRGIIARLVLAESQIKQLQYQVLALRKKKMKNS